MKTALPSIRSLPAQIERAALINFSWSRFKKGDAKVLFDVACDRVLERLKKKKKKKTKKRKEKRKKKSI